MSTRKLLNERNRLIYLMLFYKTDRTDQDFFVKEIKKYNTEISLARKKYEEFGATSQNKNVQFEYFLTKVLENNTEENREKLKNKYLELAKQRH